VAGLLAPALITLWMIWPNTELRNDIKRRLFRLQGIQPIYLVLACFLMLGSILLAQAISLLFGYSSDQFNFSVKSSFSAGIFPRWFLLFLAPLVVAFLRHRLSAHTHEPHQSIVTVRRFLGILAYAFIVR